MIGLGLGEVIKKSRYNGTGPRIENEDRSIIHLNLTLFRFH